MELFRVGEKLFNKLFKSRVKARRQGMLRIPVSLFLGILGAIGIALGAHGLYVYFTRLEFLFGSGEASKLFLEIEVPIRLKDAVVWMSYKGVQSWFIPGVFVVLGIILWTRSNLSNLISRILTKLKLW